MYRPISIKGNRGFTLVELAIVLVIIGIIIAAVTKGKDLIRSAESKKIYSTFLQQWRLAYNNYYERTGRIFDDDSANNGAAANGRPDNTGDAATLDGFLTAVGLEPVQSNLGDSNRYSYTDSNGAQHTLVVRFQSNGGRNVMLIQNVSNELGMAIDKLIDGQADGQSGSFLNGSADPASANAWATGSSNLSSTVSAYWIMDF